MRIKTNKILMNKVLKYLLLLPIFLSGCSKSQLENTKVDVTILGSSTTSITRTSIGDDLKTAIWAPGDQIAVWAKASGASAYTLAGEKFTMRYYGTSYTSAEFSATISEMSEGTYTYYGVYPYPVSVSGTQATFSLSATQSGEYDGVNDIMVATPVQSCELSGSTYATPASMSFNHLMHMIRVEIPDGSNNFEANLTGLQVTFSQDVVGNVVVDASDESVAPTISSEGGKVVTVEFAEPFETGDDKYIGLFVNPTTISGTVKFVGLGAEGSLSNAVETTINKTLSSGAVTPIALTLPEPKLLTTISVEIPSADMLSKIGEALDSVTFTLPDGVIFDDGTSSVTMAAQRDSDIYDIYLYNASDFGTSLTNGSLGVQLDTESVKKTVDGGVSLSGINVDSSNSFVAIVPYFFYTDFSEITADGNGPESMTDTDTNDYVAGLDGWVGGCRSYWYADENYISLFSYAFKFIVLVGPYQSRMTTCTLDNWGLKSGKTVALNVTYYAKWTKNKSATMSLTVGQSEGTAIGSTWGSDYTVDLEDGVSTLVSATGNNTIIGATTSKRIAWETIGNNSSSGYDEVQISDVTITIAQ